MCTKIVDPAVSIIVNTLQLLYVIIKYWWLQMTSFFSSISKGIQLVQQKVTEDANFLNEKISRSAVEAFDPGWQQSPTLSSIAGYLNKIFFFFSL